MKKRIFGLENEYGVIFTSHGRRTLHLEHIVRYLFEKLITTEYFLNVFLENGGRLYQDTGCHPEYATPECSNPYDLICYDKAGERIIEDLLIYAEKKVRDEGFYGKLSIFKNNTDFVGNSYGCHENYLVERDLDFYYLAEHLIPFFVTRQIYTGAGKIIRSKNGLDYYISQRAEHIYHKISGSTTNDRSIINTRDEPHADREKYRRLHVIVGDSNMSEYTTYLKVGATAIVLQMIEDKFIKRDMSLRDPVKAIRDISHDTTLKTKVQLDDGRAFTAIEIQKYYCELSRSYVEKTDVDPMYKDILEKWEYVLTTLEEDPMELCREIDWIIKKSLIESYIEKNNLSWNDNRILMLDLQYHDIRRDKSLYYMMERNGLVERIANEQDIEIAKTEPPRDTRAQIRGEFIKLAKKLKIPYDIDWSNIRLDSLLIGRVLCDNPFDTGKDKINELKLAIQRSNMRKFFF